MASCAVSRSWSVLEIRHTKVERIRSTHLMVVSEQLIQKINGIVTDKALIVRVDKRVPWLLRIPAKNVVVLGIQLDVVLVKVVEQIFRPENLGNLDQLVRITVPVEKWLPSKDHRREHGAQRPHVERVVVLLEVDEQLRSFEVSRRNTDVVLGSGVVELGKAPIDQPQLPYVSRRRSRACLLY